MFTKFKKRVQPRKNIQALNVDPQRYPGIFEAAPPKHLGVGLLLLLPDYTDPKQGWPLGCKMAEVGHAVSALLEVDTFKKEFTPPGVSNIRVQSMAMELPPNLLGLGPVTRSSAGLVALPLVVFFDADKNVDVGQMRGCAMAVRVIERLALASGSYEPTTHGPFSLTVSEADEYCHFVGDLYDSGTGIWSRELLPHYHAWRNGMLACLERKPMVTAMRASLVSPPKPTEIRFVASDHGPVLTVFPR